MAVLPIWKDYYADLGIGDKARYKVTCNGEDIYVGVAYRKPNEDRLWVKVNDICADYLRNEIPAMSLSQFERLSFPLEFEVRVWDEGELIWETFEIFSFVNDWSYDYDHDPSDGMASPVNGHVSARQKLLWTCINATSVVATLRFADGTTQQKTITIARTADFNADFNLDFAKSATAAGNGTIILDLSQYEGLTEVEIDGKVFPVVECGRYVLYYANAFGGWDSFLIEGNHSETDSLTRHERAVEYDNDMVGNRGRSNYVNEIRKSMTLHSSWLLGDEALRMHHLLNATEIYLYDLEKRQMMPVVLTNTTTEHKTYKGNGKQLVNYAIEVAFANDRIRR
jgi:hypothetical protein